MYQPLVFLPVLAAALFLATVLLIPRAVYRKFLIYGLMFGAASDIVLTTIFNKILNMFKWLNAGPMNVWGFNALVPVTFTFWMMLYLYFLPLRTIYLVPYVLIFTGISVAMGQVTRNLGLFTYRPGIEAIMISDFLSWYAVVAWLYRLQERAIEKRPVR
jgi:hypothetical protein